MHSAKVTMDLAIKIPSHQEGAVEELQNEADALASLPEHPNIIRAIGWAPLEHSPDGLLLEKAVCNLAEIIECALPSHAGSCPLHSVPTSHKVTALSCTCQGLLCGFALCVYLRHDISPHGRK